MIQRQQSKRMTFKYVNKGMSSLSLLGQGTEVDFHKELNGVRVETAKIAGFFSHCKPDDVVELIQTAQNIQTKLDGVFQRTNTEAHSAILSKHVIVFEVMEKLKSIVFQYVALLTVNRQTLQQKGYTSLNNRTRRKIEQYSSALLVETSVLAELSDDLLETDPSYQKSVDPNEEKVEIIDPAGRRMWVELFGETTFMVDVVKVVKGLMRELNVNLSSEERKILLQVFDPSNTGQMSSLRWNEFLKAFGPMTSCLYNLQEMLAQPWFHGFLSKSDSTKLLEVEPQGTYMVRFSSTKPGSFSLAHTMPGSIVNHVIIQTREDHFAVREESQERKFKSISALLESYSQLLVHPYAQTFPRQLWWHGDISGDDASELLRGKKQGTFIIRFSSTQRGCFASSFVGNNNVIEKGLIVGSPHGYTLSGTTFPSMEDIVDSLIKWKIFSEPYKNTTNEVNDAMRYKIVNEIVHTEKNYVKALETICNLFVREFRAHPKIKPEDVNEIFANVEQIYAVHRDFCAILERVLQNWDSETTLLGPSFLQLNPQLVAVYTVYINNYNKSMACLDRLAQKKEFKDWLFSVMSKQTKQNSLSGYMIQVIQRIPRYILLLTDLIKHTSGPHMDYDSLSDALDAIKRSADAINEAKKLYEDCERVRTLCTQISGLEQDLAVEGRYLVHEGKLAPADYKGEYYVFFFNDLCLLTRKRKKNSYNLKEILLLTNVQIIPVPDSTVSHNQFRVCTSRREITFEADSLPDKTIWVEKLKGEFSANRNKK